jgi:hypothetical protein
MMLSTTIIWTSSKQVLPIGSSGVSKIMMLSELKRDVEAIEERLTKVGEYL